MADPHDAEGVLPRFPIKTALALRKSIPQIRPAKSDPQAVLRPFPTAEALMLPFRLDQLVA